jgi:hypothetical protein
MIAYTHEIHIMIMFGILIYWYIEAFKLAYRRTYKL